MQEFAEMNQAGKWIRTSLRSISSNGSDGRAVSRLVKQLAQVLKTDTTNLRGFRKVGVGLSTVEGKAILNGFNFNNESVLSQVLKSNYQVDTATGNVSISDFIPQQDLNFLQLRHIAALKVVGQKLISLPEKLHHHLVRLCL